MIRHSGLLKWALALGTVVVSTVVTTAAWAYIPPPTFIAEEVAKAHDGIKTVIMEGRVTDLRNQSAIKELVRVDFATGKVMATYSTDTEADGIIETYLKEIHTLGKFWMNLGMDPSQKRNRLAFAELKIEPTEKMEATLDRMNGMVVYTWGQNPSATFLKDEFLPVKYQTGEGSDVDSITVTEFTSSTSSTRVPKTVIVKLQGQDVYRYDVKSVHLNPTIKFKEAPVPPKSQLAKDWVALVR